MSQDRRLSFRTTLLQKPRVWRSPILSLEAVSRAEPGPPVQLSCDLVIVSAHQIPNREALRICSSRVSITIPSSSVSCFQQLLAERIRFSFSERKTVFRTRSAMVIVLPRFEMHFCATGCSLFVVFGESRSPTLICEFFSFERLVLVNPYVLILFGQGREFFIKFSHFCIIFNL